MIVFSSVSKSFADEPTAIIDLNLEINEGDLVVITGSSGAGKTTLMKLLIKEYSPTSGDIIFENRPLSQFKKSEIPHLRRQIGVVFQDYKLIEEMNVWENIALPLYISNKKEEEIESRVTDLLNLIGLADKAMQFPRQLSGGEAQRVSIARALSTGPKLIFADEPTGNLDSEATIKITRLLKKINELGTTLLFATHDQLVLDELEKEKVIHLEKKAKETKTDKIGADKVDKKEEKKEELIDEEREKVKEKQEKLAEEIASVSSKKEEKKEKIGFPKLKLKITSKKNKEEKNKEEKDKENDEST